LLLGGGVGFDRTLDDAEALRGEFDEDASPIGRVRRPANETGALEAIDTVRHRGGREKERAREIGGTHPVRGTRAAKDAEDVVLVGVEAELVEDVLRRPLDVPSGTTDPLDDGLPGDAQVGTLAPPLFEREVDVILLSGNTAILT
jgi:hypothetical protein